MVLFLFLVISFMGSTVGGGCDVFNVFFFWDNSFSGPTLIGLREV